MFVEFNKKIHIWIYIDFFTLGHVLVSISNAIENNIVLHMVFNRFHTIMMKQKWSHFMTQKYNTFSTKIHI